MYSMLYYYPAALLRIQDVYLGARIHGSDFFHPGARFDKIPDPNPHQRISVFLTQKTDTRFSKIRS
jgi:hypothetical protein